VKEAGSTEALVVVIAGTGLKTMVEIMIVAMEVASTGQ